MKCHVYFRYSTPGDSAKRGDWNGRTTYHEGLESTLKRCTELIDQDYNVDRDTIPVPIGMLILYYSSGGSENAMPLVYEYEIRLMKPMVVQLPE